MLRKETARWAWQLAEISLNARLEDGWASLHSTQLLTANQLLGDVVAQLTFLRDTQTSILRASAEDAARHTEIQGIVLALSALLTCALLGFAFAAHYRAGLARQRARLIAVESERRFREYFDHHPLPMLIFDVETLDVITVNRAASTQYGSSPAELCATSMASLYAEDDLPSFRADLLSRYDGRLAQRVRRRLPPSQSGRHPDLRRTVLPLADLCEAVGLLHHRHRCDGTQRGRTGVTPAQSRSRCDRERGAHPRNQRRCPPSGVCKPRVRAHHRVCLGSNCRPQRPFAYTRRQAKRPFLADPVGASKKPGREHIGPQPTSKWDHVLEPVARCIGAE